MGRQEEAGEQEAGSRAQESQQQGGAVAGLAATAAVRPGHAQLVKNPLAMQETRVQPLDGEDPREKGMATQSKVLAWRIPMDRGAWRATVSSLLVPGVSSFWCKIVNCRKPIKVLIKQTKTLIS